MLYQKKTKYTSLTRFVAAFLAEVIFQSQHLQERFEQLRGAYPGAQLLIVSNSAGTSSDPTGAEADLLERSTGVKVLRHGTKVGSIPQLKLNLVTEQD